MSAHLADELLAAHLDGTLSPSEREAAESHLAVCAQCREELELAGGARDALRALPTELRPPRDIVAAVTREATGRPVVAAAAPSEPPRWYRAAAVVAVAAAIGLGAIIVPRLGRSDQADRALSGGTAAEASQVAPQSSAAAGLEAGDGGSNGSNATASASLPLRTIDRDFDDAALSALLLDASRTAALEAASPTADAVTTDEGDTAMSCVRSAAGGRLTAEVTAVRLIVATYRGTPALIGIFESTSDDRGTLLFVAARDGCGLLASGSSASGTVVPAPSE
jgi:hypothetical protein